MEKYMYERALNQMRTALSGNDKYTMGHMRGTAADTWWFPGMEMSTIQIQKGEINRRALQLHRKYLTALKNHNDRYERERRSRDDKNDADDDDREKDRANNNQ